jgi:hypothetical protein
MEENEDNQENETEKNEKKKEGYEKKRDKGKEKEESFEYREIDNDINSKSDGGDYDTSNDEKFRELRSKYKGHLLD